MGELWAVFISNIIRVCGMLIPVFVVGLENLFIFRSTFNRVYILQASPLACQRFAWCSVVEEIWHVCSSIVVKHNGMPITVFGAGLSSASSNRCIYRFAIVRVWPTEC